MEHGLNADKKLSNEPNGGERDKKTIKPESDIRYQCLIRISSVATHFWMTSRMAVSCSRSVSASIAPQLVENAPPGL